MREDQFLSKDHVDTALDASFTRFKVSFYRALFVQAVAIGGLTTIIFKFLS